MPRHRFSFDVSFRHVVDVDVAPGTPRARSRIAATSYLANQLALMDWEDLLCHAHEAVPIDGESDGPSDEARLLDPAQAVIVPVDPPVAGAGYAFHPDDPAGRHEAYIQLIGSAEESQRRVN